MTDLERLFRRLVDNLIAIDPARLHRPLTIADLLTSVVPYRTTRRALGLDSAEDYDALVLQLCSGQGGYVRMLSDDVTQALKDQLTLPNPDLDVLRDHERAELVLGTEPLAHALGPGPDEAFAPPEVEEEFTPPEPQVAPPAPRLVEPSRRISFSAEPAPPMVPPPPRMTAEPEQGPQPLAAHGARCSFCGDRLPAGRTINFCPHCGQNQSLTRCPECRSELELGWRHCISCGHPVAEP